MKTVSLKLSDDLDLQLSEAARRRGVTKSALIRDALSSYLEKADPGSFAVRATDLAGCVSAPEDLSSNPEHMDAYGR